MAELAIVLLVDRNTSPERPCPPFQRK